MALTTLLHAWPYVDHQGVGALDQRMEQLASLRHGIVDGDTALMAIVRLEMRTGDAAREPAIDRLAAVIQHPPPGLDPVDAGGSLAPEPRRVGDRAGMDGVEHTRHRQRLLPAGQFAPSPARETR